MTKNTVTKEYEICQETYTQDLLEDITLPLDPILTYMRAAEHTEKGACPHVTDILLKNAEKNLKEIANALETKFGKIKIEHEEYDADSVLNPWGKVVGVIVNGKKKSGEV